MVTKFIQEGANRAARQGKPGYDSMGDPLPSAMPAQSEAQRNAALSAAGLSEPQKKSVISGEGYYSRLTPTSDEGEDTPKYGSLYESSRADEIARQEGNLKSIEDIYRNKLESETQREREIGARDVARSNTISAMTGMTGAPEATTREGMAERRTEDRIKSVEARVAAEKASAVNAIYGRIDQNAARAAEIELKTKREEQDALRKETAVSATNNILSFASKQGIDWNTFSKAAQDDKDLQAEIKRTGKSLPELYELYTSNQPAPPKKTYTWKGNNLVVVQEDAKGTISTQTFDATELGIPKGTDFQTVTLGESVYWIDKDDRFNADGTPKLIRLGAKPATGKPPAQTPEGIPTFDEFVDEFMQTPQGQQMATGIQGERGQSLTPEALRSAIAEKTRGLYDNAKAETLAKGGGTEYDKGRQIIESADSKDWGTLRSKILEETKMNATEVDALLVAQGLKKPKASDTSSTTSSTSTFSMTDEEFMDFLKGK